MAPLTRVSELRIIAGVELCFGATMFVTRFEFTRRHGFVATEFSYLTVWAALMIQALLGSRGLFELSRYSGSTPLLETRSTVGAHRRAHWLWVCSSLCVVAAEVVGLVTESSGVVLKVLAAALFAVVGALGVRGLWRSRGRAATEVLSPISLGTH